MYAWYTLQPLPYLHIRMRIYVFWISDEKKVKFFLGILLKEAAGLSIFQKYFNSSSSGKFQKRRSPKPRNALWPFTPKKLKYRSRYKPLSIHINDGEVICTPSGVSRHFCALGKIKFSAPQPVFSATPPPGPIELTCISFHRFSIKSIYPHPIRKIKIITALVGMSK